MLLKEVISYCNRLLSCVQDSHPLDWVLQKAPRLEEVHEDDEPTRRQAIKDQFMKHVSLNVFTQFCSLDRYRTFFLTVLSQDRQPLLPGVPKLGESLEACGRPAQFTSR